MVDETRNSRKCKARIKSDEQQKREKKARETREANKNPAEDPRLFPGRYSGGRKPQYYDPAAFAEWREGQLAGQARHRREMSTQSKTKEPQLIHQPWTIMSIGHQKWAHEF